jgi:hypothetical protein
LFLVLGPVFNNHTGVAFSMGKYTLFPPWSNDILTIRSCETLDYIVVCLYCIFSHIIYNLTILSQTTQIKIVLQQYLEKRVFEEWFFEIRNLPLIEIFRSKFNDFLLEELYNTNGVIFPDLITSTMVLSLKVFDNLQIMIYSYTHYLFILHS